MIIRDRTSCIACHAQESHRGVWNHNCSVPNLGTIVQLNPTSILPVIFNLRKADDAVPDVTHQEFFSVWQDGIPNDRCFAFLASAGARHNSPPELPRILGDQRFNPLRFTGTATLPRYCGMPPKWSSPPRRLRSRVQIVRSLSALVSAVHDTGGAVL